MPLPKRFPSLLRAQAAACLVLGAACGGGKLDPTGTGGGGDIAITGAGGAGSSVGTGGAGSSVGAGGNIGIGGSIGGGGPPISPCLGPTDRRLVVAPQRRVMLTSHEVYTMIRALVGQAEADAVRDGGVFPFTPEVDWSFPPAAGEPFWTPRESSMPLWTNAAKHLAQYVFDNYAAVTGCAPTDDACAKTYLHTFAEKAYRRPLDTNELSTLDAGYDDARNDGGPNQTAVQRLVTTILVAPPYMYRSEMGDLTRLSQAPPGISLTPYELASALSFFLTDEPPDQPLLDDARAGALTPDRIAPHVDRLLATPAARDWLRKMVETYLLLNQLPGIVAVIDPFKFPKVTVPLIADMQTEARKFLDLTLWNGTLADMLTSRTTFLNSTLATTIYDVPVPPGATSTTWIQTTLPATQRSGLLTNAGFLTARARSDRAGLVPRGSSVYRTILGGLLVPHPDSYNVPNGPIDRARMNLLTQTAQEQVASRAAIPMCASCHVHFDGYGLALDNYDNIGVFRTTDDLGKPVDPHATLPPELGGSEVANAVELARVLADSAAFTNQMAWAMLQYAMIDYTAEVERIDPAMGRAGCAVADVVARLEAGGARTFPALVRAVALSPAFSLRGPAPVPLP